MATMIAPVPRRRRGSSQSLSAARQERLAMAAGAPATAFIDGEGYMPMASPVYGSGARQLQEQQVGVGTMSNGMTGGGAIGSGLMRGRLPASMESPQMAARTPTAGGGLIGSPGGGAASSVSEEAFQDAWNRAFRPWKVAKPENQELAGGGRNVVTRTPDGGVVIENVPIVGGKPFNAGAAADAALGARAAFADSTIGATAGAVRNPVAPVSRTPVQPAPAPVGGWPASMGARPVVQPTTAAASPVEQAAAVAAGTPAASVTPAGPGVFRRAAPYAAAGGAGALIGGMASSGQPTTPLPPAPEGTQNQWYSRQYSQTNSGLTTDPIVAANRAAFEASMANRKNRAAGRGIAKGESRDLRMGQASPEVLARANLAQGDVSLDRDWQGNVRMTRTMAPLVGMYGAQERSVSDASEPMLIAQAARYNTDMAAAQAEMAAATTPETQAIAMQRMRAIQQQQFSVPQGQTPSQFMQGALGNEFSGTVSGQPQVVNTPIAPVRPSGSQGEATPATVGGNAIGTRPVAPPKTGNIVTDANAEAETRRRQAAYDAQVSASGRGEIPFRPQDREVLDNQNVTLDQAAAYLSQQWGVPMAAAIAAVQKYRSRPFAGPVPNFIPGGSAVTRPVMRGGF